MAESYEARLQEYLAREVHPETARNIGRIVWSSQVGSAEFAMAIILQMQLDHCRRDEEIAGQATLPLSEYAVPVIERPEAAQLRRI